MRSVKAGLRLSIIRYLATAYCAFTLAHCPNPFQIRVGERGLCRLWFNASSFISLKPALAQA